MGREGVRAEFGTAAATWQDRRLGTRRRYPGALVAGGSVGGSVICTPITPWVRALSQCVTGRN